MSTTGFIQAVSLTVPSGFQLFYNPSFDNFVPMGKYPLSIEMGTRRQGKLYPAQICHDSPNNVENGAKRRKYNFVQLH